MNQRFFYLSDIVCLFLCRVHELEIKETMDYERKAIAAAINPQFLPALFFSLSLFFTVIYERFQCNSEKFPDIQLLGYKNHENLQLLLYSHVHTRGKKGKNINFHTIKRTKIFSSRKIIKGENCFSDNRNRNIDVIEKEFSWFGI